MTEKNVCLRGRGDFRVAATLKKLANELDLSVSTVSRILNGKGRFPEETRRRVLTAAKKLDYAPNLYARSLREQSYRVIGLIVPNVTNPYYSSILEKIEEECRQAGYTLLINVSNYIESRAKDYVDYLMASRVGGMILASHDVDEEILHVLERGLHVVSLNEHRPDVHFSWVSIDNRRAMFDLTQYMINLRHSNIACLYGDRENMDDITAEMRKTGYLECMKQNGLEVREDMLIRAGLTYTAGKEAAGRLICRPQMPTAIVCHNNEVAAGAYDAFTEAGFEIPRDLSIGCFDSIIPTQVIGRRFTAIIQPLDAICHEAVQLLIREKTGEEKPKRVRFPYEFVKGETTQRCGEPTRSVP